MNYLIIGLGNPGREYDLTRHNIGKAVIQELAYKEKKSFSKKGFYNYFQLSIGNVKSVVVQPLTFVNESGIATKNALSDFPNTQLVVVHDDLDLPFGALRIKVGGKSGGHNGILSIIDTLGTTHFWRLKIGIGRLSSRKDPADYVLEPFSKTEQKEVPFIIEKAIDALLYLIKHGPEAAMNKFH